MVESDLQIYKISGVVPFPASMILTQAQAGHSLGLIAGLCVLIIIMTFLFYGVNKAIHNKYNVI